MRGSPFWASGTGPISAGDTFNGSIVRALQTGRGMAGSVPRRGLVLRVHAGVLAETAFDPAGKLVEALRALCKDLEVPTPQAHGVDKDDWLRLAPLVAEQALESGPESGESRSV